MKQVTTLEDVRACRWQRPLETWGLVPTMGYLHEGHLSLVRRALHENDRVGVSIFVNPAQFNDADDLEKYPSNLKNDLRLLADEGIDLVWTPSSNIVYPEGFQTVVNVELLTSGLEGRSRPGHFRGVTTVVCKLFNLFQPQRAYFGQKDAQQAVVVKRMVEDLNFNLEVVVCPTVREANGLAMSSRNANLTPDDRRHAACLYQALLSAQDLFHSGERSAQALKQKVLQHLASVKQARVDYVSIADPETLAELERVEDRALVSLAVFMAEVRLIDNILLVARP